MKVNDRADSYLKKRKSAFQIDDQHLLADLLVTPCQYHVGSYFCFSKLVKSVGGHLTKCWKTI